MPGPTRSSLTDTREPEDASTRSGTGPTEHHLFVVAAILGPLIVLRLLI